MFQFVYLCDCYDDIFNLHTGAKDYKTIKLNQVIVRALIHAILALAQGIRGKRIMIMVHLVYFKSIIFKAVCSL